MRIVRRPHEKTQTGLRDLHPVLAQVYYHRNLTDPGELDHSLERLLPPTDLVDIDRATRLLAELIGADGRILIVADFDADGATSCALAVRALRAMGAKHVDFLVPNRFEYGYGLTPEIVEVAVKRQPDLIVTVDNGISSIEGVKAAGDHGIRVLITDHHLAGSMLPAAIAIVNPNRPNDTFASKNLAGVGVIFYVMLALRARLRADGWFARRAIPQPNLARMLDLVALGTVADVVPLDYNNRILVAQGLKRIREGQCCAGIRALLEVGGREVGRITAADLGFVIGPRLNAAGRLEDMSLGIACLLADDSHQALALARQLDQLNHERRSIEAGMQTQALNALRSLQMVSALPAGLCLFDESWHQGVIGILAARIKERIHRPVIAFAPANALELKGSARSVSGLHIRDTLDAVATRHPGLLRRFGGHAMAAGLTLERSHLEAFRAAFAEEVARRLDSESLQGAVVSDGALEGRDMTLELALLLRAGGPWGPGFPEPLFDGTFEIAGARNVGEKHLKLVLRHADGAELDAIAFNHAAGPWKTGRRVHAAYRLDVNVFKGASSVQLIVTHLASAEPGDGGGG
ncbi:MAG: single-stranded-DNA-specific exonuclease RecJ [Acidiferrobacterales bacterium]